MTRYFTILLLVVIMPLLPAKLYAQKDVTQFLGIAVDGYKPEMIKKLKAKGFTSSASKNDILTGQFNGTNVNIHIVTNNNKVCRIMVVDANHYSEGDIKIRFNKLCQQFHNNKKYHSVSDSTAPDISKFNIPDDEDISYEMSVKNKRYEAVFYQKNANYDSLVNEMSTLFTKTSRTAAEEDRFSKIFSEMMDTSYFNKVVWFMINEHYGKYYISMYYDNEYNRANGEDL